jgi:glycosyltransferase involved in cell wall biosynthesis
MRSKVIVVSGKDPTLIYGGSESFTRSLGRAALRAGYEPHHFCIAERSERLQTDFGVVHRVWSPVRPLRTIMVAQHQPFLVAQIDHFVGDDAGPVLIHSIGSFPGVAAAVARRLRRRGVKAVILSTPFTTCRHEIEGKILGLRGRYVFAVWLQHQIERLWVRLTAAPNEGRGYRQADLVAPNYASVQAIIEAEFGPGIRFGRMTYASEMAFLREAEDRPAPAAIGALEPRTAPLIVSVSRHDLRKGIDTLLHALAELKRRGVPFRACLVGGGPLLDWHRQLAARLGLAQETLLTGRVDDSYAYLQQAGIYVLPSLEEGSGSVSLLEAMQAGVAPVVSRIDGLPEDVEDDVSAVFVTPGDVGALAEALNRCLSDPELRRRLGNAAQARFQERFSADGFAADVRKTYGSLGFAPSCGKGDAVRPAGTDRTPE